MPRPGPRRPVTISDVAERAEVSVTTVSHVLSGRRPVSAATRGRVEAVIAELGYQPNPLARSLRTRRSHTLALLIPDITNPFYPALARGLQDVVSGAGYQVLISNTDADPAAERAALAQMISRRVDAIGFAAYYTRIGELAPAVDAGIPVVLLGARTPRPGVDVLSTDDLAAGEIATRYLLGRGHRRIGFLAAPDGAGPAADRVEGYRHALAAAGIPPDAELLVRREISRQGGQAGMGALLALAQPPQAVLCTNDLVAIGALDEARTRGLSVPGDVAVMGIDDIDAATLVSPALTTVSVAPREQGRALGRLLLGRLDATVPAEPQRVVFDPAVVPRESA